MKIKSPFFREMLLKKHLYIIALIISNYFEGQTINITGSNWAVNIPTITEAGTDYKGTYDNPNQLTLSGSLPGSFLSLLTSAGARVSMHYVPTLWNSNLHLYAKRNGGNTTINGFCILCNATINGGNVNYIEIPQAASATLSTITFTGLLGVNNSVTYSSINVQLEIGGVSVTIPAATYSAQIVFTIGAN